ncbi:thiamine ABC transporter ATP-binding protein ThiQ [Pantoea sp. 1.19]|uniref:thiamine ABC transporter ATP-binding protein ThiQ n=1 Tax=Pantoea sp. 1.19 TaxID=1925589 RepID=UPI000948F097|nr:thiamine ABC transporter ATP-binding protein ThiQ [Pantoea sp. 1.19]
MLNLENLTWHYHHRPMRFSLRLNAGERLAVLGPSGAGKSTLLNLIAGFLPARAGQLWINGQQVTGAPPARRGVSMLFQENNLFTHLTVAQNMGLGLDPALRLSAAQQREVAAIAERVGLTDCLPRLPGALSGGQRQRVALARCLLRQQPVLLLDEPFSALDPALRGEMLQLLDEVCAERQLTLVMVSHSVEDAARIARRSALVAEGTIAWQGDTRALLAGETPAAALLGISVR